LEYGWKGEFTTEGQRRSTEYAEERKKKEKCGPDRVGAATKDWGTWKEKRS
jgi:hypothetical protein